VSRAIYLAPWRIDLTVRDQVMVPMARIELARVMAAALAVAGAPRPASIGLILSDDAELAELNAAHLDQTEATDVLSFPLLPPAAFPPHRGAAAASGPGVPFILPPRRRPHLGDVVVSVERAIEQAEQGRGGQSSDRRWDPRDELRLLVTHGVLHVCGWDHADADEAIAMRTLETRLLS
jgi:probable rRNA maturation factor